VTWGAIASRTSVGSTLVAAAAVHLVVTGLSTAVLRIGDDVPGTVAG